MQDEYRFNAFGRLLSVVRSNDRWAVFDLGAEGKRRPANLQIPSALAADELAQYLGDLLHEDASPKYHDVVAVPVPVPPSRRA
ncbi:DUF7661 family protein [Burkholderia ambifaria]|uniref:DUF7661 family protein n=1 Tax=Burkholderia ambifaria TaxID=152480 RepID=UPI00158D0F5E|nr:hypothetical protein [Burkholderia ambifaria]